MNILLANWSWYPSGGDWTYVEEVARLYANHGHKVVPFAMQDAKNFPSEFSSYFLDHIDYQELNRRRSFFSGARVLYRSIYSLHSQRLLGRLLENTRIDVAHLNNIHNYHTPSIIPLLKKHGAKIIWTIHDYILLCPENSFVSRGELCEKCKGGQFYHCVLNRCKKGSRSASLVASLGGYVSRFLGVFRDVDQFICPSKFVYEKFLEYGFPEDRVSFVSHCCSLGPSECAVDSEAMPVGDYALFVGRLERIKGLHTLLRALKLVPQVNMVVAGGGSLERELLAMRDEMNLRNVYFVGKRTKQEIQWLARGCRFLVCPSEWYEVLGLAVVEAMLLGKPVIASEIGALPELVIDGTTGLLHLPGVHQDLAGRLQELWSSPERCRKMGSTARLRSLQMFDPETHYRRLAHIAGLR
jgi:glycosyltransferase involved in cell wall biosynthesis